MATTKTYSGLTPWSHGIAVSTAVTASEAIETAGLNWHVRKEPLVAHLENGVDAPVFGKFLTIRDGDIPLGVVGKNFTVLQNNNAFALVDAIRQLENDTIYEQAGLVGMGEKVWIVAKMPGEIQIKDTDEYIDKRFMMFNAHNGTKSLLMGFVPTHRSSATVFSYGGFTDRFSVRHTRNLDHRLKEANKALRIAENYYNSLGDMFNALADVTVDSAKMREVLDKVMPFPAEIKEGDDLPARTANMREKVTEMFETVNAATPSLSGTGYTLFSAFAQFADHERAFKGKKGQAGGQDDNRLLSIFEGSSLTLKNEVVEALLA